MRTIDEKIKEITAALQRQINLRRDAQNTILVMTQRIDNLTGQLQAYEEMKADGAKADPGEKGQTPPKEAKS
jgi:hypothetical protein